MTDFYILDSAMGTELAYRGYDLPDWKESIWSAKALNDGQDLIRSIHEDNIAAGCNVITTSNYYATPLILNGMGKKYNYLELTEVAIELAHKAVDSKNKNVMIAGSFPPINISFRPDLIPSNNIRWIPMNMKGFSKYFHEVRHGRALWRVFLIICIIIFHCLLLI